MFNALFRSTDTHARYAESERPERERGGEHPPVWVVIPAAGVGARMQVDRPKQYLSLAGKTVIEHTLACFTSHPAVAGIIVSVSVGDPYWQVIGPRFTDAIYTVPGGAERSGSVLNGLLHLRGGLTLPEKTLVMVHDAARPCLIRDDMNRLLSAGMQHPDGALLATPVRDTMKRASVVSGDCVVAHTESREHLWHALTPQIASLGVLTTALQNALHQGVEITDEASALEHAGLHPKLVEGQASNIKITRPADLALAEFFLSQKNQPADAIHTQSQDVFA